MGLDLGLLGGQFDWVMVIYLACPPAHTLSLAESGAPPFLAHEGWGAQVSHVHALDPTFPITHCGPGPAKTLPKRLPQPCVHPFTPAGLTALLSSPWRPRGGTMPPSRPAGAPRSSLLNPPPWSPFCHVFLFP